MFTCYNALKVKWSYQTVAVNVTPNCVTRQLMYHLYVLQGLALCLLIQPFNLNVASSDHTVPFTNPYASCLLFQMPFTEFHSIVSQSRLYSVHLITAGCRLRKVHPLRYNVIVLFMSDSLEFVIFISMVNVQIVPAHL
jgi:hypothetical protein